MVNGWLYRYQSCISQPGQVVTNGVSNTRLPDGQGIPLIAG